MINSWGSFPPTGLFEGTSSDFGSYDQCLSIEPNGIIGEPQYCMIDLSPPIPQPMPIHHNLYHRIDVLPQEYYDRNITENSTNIFDTFSEFASFYYWISLRTGICMPSKCLSDDITQLAKAFADKFGLEFRKIQCQTKSNNSLNFIQITAMYYKIIDNFIIFYLTDIQFFFFQSFFILVFIMISFMATLMEKYNTKKSHKSLFIYSFSLRQNLKSLFANRSSEEFPCIHGIRVFTLVWVIFSHSAEWTNFQLFSRSFQVKQIFTRIESQLILNGVYSVESFFFIGYLINKKLYYAK
jgi:hypothetical protein